MGRTMQSSFIGPHGHQGYRVKNWHLMSYDDQRALGDWCDLHQKSWVHRVFKNDGRGGSFMEIEFHDLEAAVLFKLTWVDR